MSRSVLWEPGGEIPPGDPAGCCFGRAQEKSGPWRTERRHNPATGGGYALLVRATAFINFFDFHCVDDDCGPFFIKFSTHFPFTAKLHQRKRVGQEPGGQGPAKAGIRFTALDNRGSPPSTVTCTEITGCVQSTRTRSTCDVDDGRRVMRTVVLWP